MSRTSRIPYHQNVYNLFDVARLKHLPEAATEIAAWELIEGERFPAAMVEFYTTAVTLRTGGDDPQDWTLTLPELWSEYSNDERARAVPEVFQTFIPRPWVSISASPTPGFELIWENQGNWVMCARADGTDDPLVDVSGLCSVSPRELWDRWETGWHTIGRFSEMLISWFALYYLEPFTPISYSGEERRRKLVCEHEPPKPYANGLWLRTPSEPFEPAVIDYLTERFDEPERTPRPGDVTTYTFRPPGGTIRVTADAPTLGGGLSAWWLHADTPERLAELARLVVPFGTLRETLRADTDPAREVLRTVT